MRFWPFWLSIGLWLRLWIRPPLPYPQPVSIGSQRILTRFQDDQSRRRTFFPRDLITFVGLFFSPLVRGPRRGPRRGRWLDDGHMPEQGLLPRDKPSCWTALSLVRLPIPCAGGRSRPASQPSKDGNDRSRAALGPRSTAGRTSRLDRFPHPSDGDATRLTCSGGAQSTPPASICRSPMVARARRVNKGEPLNSRRAKRAGERTRMASRRPPRAASAPSFASNLRKAPAHPKGRPPVLRSVVCRSCLGFPTFPAIPPRTDSFRNVELISSHHQVSFG